MAGIEDGVLIALEKMNDLSLSSSGEVVSLGPGNHWGRVYEILESQGLAVTGGEMAVVGIAGLLTGSTYPLAPLPEVFLFSFCLLASNEILRIKRRRSLTKFSRWSVLLPRQPWLVQRRRDQFRGRSRRWKHRQRQRHRECGSLVGSQGGL